MKREQLFMCVFHSLPPIIIQTNWSIYPSIGQFAALQGILDSFSVRWKQPNNTETDSGATILWSFHQPKTHFFTFRKNLYVFFSPTNEPTFTVLILHNGSWNATIPRVRNFTLANLTLFTRAQSFDCANCQTVRAFLKLYSLGFLDISWP